MRGEHSNAVNARLAQKGRIRDGVAALAEEVLRLEPQVALDDDAHAAAGVIFITRAHRTHMLF